MDNFYFKDSYKAEIDCIESNIKLLDAMVNTQIKIEKQYNTHLHESLNLSYSYAQAKERDGWDYSSIDEYLQDLVEKFKAKEQAGEIQVHYQEDEEEGLSDTNESENPLSQEEQAALQKQQEKEREARRKEREK